MKIVKDGITIELSLEEYILMLANAKTQKEIKSLVEEESLN
jgi:hypothetical protein